MAIDPVCGMTVDEKTTELKSEYMGQTYYFCSAGCKKSFDDDPAKYASGEQASMGHEGHPGVRSTAWPDSSPGLADSAIEIVLKLD